MNDPGCIRLARGELPCERADCPERAAHLFVSADKELRLCSKHFGEELETVSHG